MYYIIVYDVRVNFLNIVLFLLRLNEDAYVMEYASKVFKIF